MANRKSNFPNAQQVDASPGEIGTMVRYMEELRELSKPNTENEIEDRIKWFFEWCSVNDVRPGVELLALALGTTRQNLWLWQQNGGRKGQLVTMAKQVLAALLEQWGQTGKINPAALCFLMKNHFGYQDNVRLEIEPQKMLEATQTPDEIEDRLLRIEQDIPIDDDYALEDE